MKKFLIISLTVLALFSISNQVAAQSQSCLTVMPIHLIFNTLNIQYEHYLPDLGSLLLAAKAEVGSPSSNSFALKLGYRKYFGRDPFAGLFAEGGLGAFYSKKKYGNSSMSLGLKVSGGYKYTNQNGFTIEAGLGTTFVTDQGPVFSIDDSFINPRLAIGYSW